MAIDHQKYLEKLASEVLSVFEAISKAATEAIRNYEPPVMERGGGADFLNAVAIQNARVRIGNQRLADDKALQKEPAIARVRARDEKGKEITYYVARFSPPSPSLAVGGESGVFVSYRAPVGRLASLEAGDAISLPNGELEVVERAVLRPENDDGWDSRDSVVETLSITPVTVQSLRRLLAQPDLEEGLEALAAILAEDDQSENIREGLRRSVITKMALRDQPVLDKFQDEIFRLPLSNQLLILGPPGTGKTTTLIRRLGQKLDRQFLEPEERAVVERAEQSGDLSHEQSWLMFTPTDLLKQYVKEAFAKEGIAASEQRITTWDDFRRDLARSTFPILRTNTETGVFVLKENLDSVGGDARADLIAWYQDFDEWQRKKVLEQFERAAGELTTDSDKNVAALGLRASQLFAGRSPDELDEVVVALAAISSNMQERASVLKGVSDRRIDEALNLQINRNGQFLDEFGAFLNEVQESGEQQPDDALEDVEADEEDEAPKVTTSRAYAIAQYRRFARAQARAYVRKRSIRAESLLGRISKWMGERGLSEARLDEVGRSLLTQARLRQLATPLRRTVGGVARRYRQYRTTRQAENRWYQRHFAPSRDLSPLELDLVLLSALRSVGALLRRLDAGLSYKSAEWDYVRNFRTVRRNQILVDEATDFSPIQLSCMAAMAHPATQSFFGCGDFNQRLTTWGSQNFDQVKWAIRGLSARAVSVSYRQSNELINLARKLAQLGGAKDSELHLPEQVENSGVRPVLAENLKDDAVVGWLCDRIREIEAFSSQLPSIAVLVSDESQVNGLATRLNEALIDVNIRVVPYLKGQAIGQENDVRVFDVQHIKGLEFEAVFFVGVDRLAALHPELFEKYLYVGTTRAATYLGMSSVGELPPALKPLRELFSDKW